MRNEADATRMRLKQDFLIMLAVDMGQYDESLRIDEKQSAPTLFCLRQFIYPDWEWAIDAQINDLANRQHPKVGVPDFNYLAGKVAHNA